MCNKVHFIDNKLAGIGEKSFSLHCIFAEYFLITHLKIENYV